MASLLKLQEQAKARHINPVVGVVKRAYTAPAYVVWIDAKGLYSPEKSSTTNSRSLTSEQVSKLETILSNVLAEKDASVTLLSIIQRPYYILQLDLELPEDKDASEIVKQALKNVYGKNQYLGGITIILEPSSLVFH